MILKTGEAGNNVPASAGDFEHWFGRHLAPMRHRVLDARSAPDWPEPASLAGLLITGSAAMVTDRAPWSVAAATFVRSAIDAGLPTLGVCFGHQMIADALGGRVDYNPRGRQIGSVRISLEATAQDDPLMAGFSDGDPVYTTHRQAVLELPAGVVHLASSPRDPHHAFRYGDHCWGLQFHPEFDCQIMASYVRSRAHELIAEGFDTDLLLEQIKPSPPSSSLLSRYSAICAARC